MIGRGPPVPGWLGRLLCFLGFHDFRIVEVSFGFGPGNTVEKVECRRCGFHTTRRN
ncbi:MAG TPA: hypothetical protein VIT83_00430 [Gammaproteobacteria bacterium]